MTGRIEAVWKKRAHYGPMDAQTQIRLVAGKGVEGSVDNSKTRQVTLIEREVWENLMLQLGADAPASRRRANIMLSGISLANSRGRLLRIGTAVIRIGGELKPCERMDEVSPGLRELMYPHWQGGAFAQVVQTGEAVPEDSVEWVSPEIIGDVPTNISYE